MKIPGDNEPSSNGDPSSSGGRGGKGDRGGNRRLGAGRVRTPAALRSSRRRRIVIGIVLVALAFVLLALRGIASFYTNYLWYQSVHRTDVWRTVVETKLGLGTVFTLGLFAALWASLLAVDRLAARAAIFVPELELTRRYRAAVVPHAGLVRTGIAAIVALLVGSGAASQWQNWVLFEHEKKFPGVFDPLLNKNAGFYVFRLPFLTFLVNWMLLAVLVVLLVTVVFYFVNGGIRLQGSRPRVDQYVIAHCSLLFGVLALLKAVSYYYIQRPRLDLSGREIFDGASYTDVHVQLPAFTLLAVVSLVCFIVLVVNVYQRNLVLPAMAVGLWALIALVIGVIYPAAVEAFKVQPASATLENTYIMRNIHSTRYAYGIGKVRTKQLAAIGSVPLGSFEPSIDGVNLWDPAVTQKTFQSANGGGLAPYYTLSPLQLDRYPIDGVATPVLVSARMINSAAVSNQSWVNTHLVYTHGYGMVAAYANTSKADGSPRFWLTDEPCSNRGVQSTGVTGREVYVGTGLSGYVVLDTKVPEFDYACPGGSSTSTARPSGGPGVRVGSVWARAALALHLLDVNLIPHGSVTSESHVLYIRNVDEIVSKAAPFLKVDSVPYPVLTSTASSVGPPGVYWIVNAYTTSNYFPYSQQADTSGLPSTSALNGSYNYVRDSVIAAVSAYSGQVKFYATGSDPVLSAYVSAFPNMFKPLDTMPSSLRAHLRYPQDLLTVLSAMYGRYHLKSPGKLAEAIGQWIPSPAAASGSLSGVPTPANGSIQTFQPAYQLSQLPSSRARSVNATSFNVWEPMSPDVPTSPGHFGQQDLAALFVASCDYPDYGSLTAYTTPGPPDAVPAPASADTRMMEQLAREKLGATAKAGGQGVALGSMSVLLLATPHASNVIYIRPVYVTSSGGSQDQLRGVLAASASKVTFASSLPLAIADLLEPTPPAEISPRGGGAVPAEVKRLLKLAQQDFAAAQQALRRQELGSYESHNSAGIRYVEQAYDLLAKSAPAKGKHASKDTGAAKPAPPSTSPSTASSGRSAGTTTTTGQGAGATGGGEGTGSA